MHNAFKAASFKSGAHGIGVAKGGGVVDGITSQAFMKASQCPAFFDLASGSNNLRA